MEPGTSFQELIHYNDAETRHQRLAYSREIVVHEVNGDHRCEILISLRESIRQTCEAAHRHPHRKIQTLNIACADVIGIGIPARDFHITADADRWRIAGFILSGCSLNLL
jgi:hypothetical protein